MRRRFRLTPGGQHPHDPWFHIGTLEVTTTWLVVILSVAGMILYAVAGLGSVEANLGLTKFGVVNDYKIWTLVTWPFAYWTVSLWDAVAIFLFWYFGSDIERNVLGRNRFAWMLLIWTVVLGALMVGLTALAGEDLTALYGLNLLELMVLLLWIAEWPQRMFFFNIPAWLIGLVLVGIQVIQYLGSRNWTLLVDFLVGIVLCAIIARSFGMLTEYPWLPRLALPRRRPRPPHAAKPGKRGFDPGRPTVVPGPWQQEPSRPAPVPSRDEQRMDELLDKIHAHGTESLSDAERAELLELRARRRRHS